MIEVITFMSLCCRTFLYPLNLGTLSDPGTAPGGAGWPRQNSRFLHTVHSHRRFYCQSRSVHDTVVAKLTPEDIKKAREAKQGQAKPVRQKVGLKWLRCISLHIMQYLLCIHKNLDLSLFVFKMRCGDEYFMVF